jgi:uncharacterized membrane protein
MRRIRGSGIQVLLLLLSLLGMGISIYLTFVHYENAPLVCSDSGLVNCARVLSSSYADVPGTSVPITLPGLAWCAVGAVLAIAGLYAGLGGRRLRVMQFAWSFLGMLTVLYLVYVEIVRLHTICAWCTAFHALILLMFLLSLVRLQAPEFELEFASEEESEESTVDSIPQSK